LISGDGDDVLVAGNEKSVLYAGRGRNSLTGGRGNDIFVVMAGKGRSLADSDTLHGFNATSDIILIVGLKCLKFKDLLFTQVNNSQDVLISWSPSNQSQTVLVKNVSVNELNAQNVIIQQRLKLPKSYLDSNSTDNDNNLMVNSTSVIKVNGSQFTRIK
jgi:hypothetical protein